MSETVELPQVLPTADTVPSAVPADIRVANTASIASAITAVCGLSGGGKSSLADTAAEYAHEVHNCTTLCYAIDPGGFGTKRVALIRAGIMHVWDPRNHVNYFETMELASLGAWPETIVDAERGYAEPDVKLILPRRLVVDLICPAGHVARRFDNEGVMNVTLAQMSVPCAVCGVLTNLQNAARTDRLIVRHRMFRKVGLRIYDSITAMNDAGLIIELPTMSAKNQFAKGKEGGSALGAADAFKQGTISYGTGSEAQVGFMQNRTYGWLMNIRQLPDVKVPTICTFGIEESKKDDESGGLQILGPRIAGKARTSAVPGWVGNLVYASHEPEDLPRGTAVSPNMVFRLWLTTHTDPRDSRRMPILAKHRGTPLGIDFLEDPWDVDIQKRKANAWKGCSLKRLFQLLDAQVAEEEAALRLKYPDAPGFVEQEEETGPVDDVVGQAGGRQVIVTSPNAVVTSGVVQLAQATAAAAQPAAGMPRVARRGGRVAPVAAPVPAALVQAQAAAAMPLPQQLEASIAEIEAKKVTAGEPVATLAPTHDAGVATSQVVTTPAVTPMKVAEPVPATIPAGAAAPQASSATATPPPAVVQPVAPVPPAPAAPAAVAVGAPRVVRRPKPPIN